MALDLSLLKKQCNVDFNDDDTYLTHLLDAAKEQVLIYTNRTDAELKTLGPGTTWPASAEQAALMLASHWYNQREAVASVNMTSVPFGFDSLVRPYRKLINDSI